MGLTYFVGEEVLAATVIHIADDGQSIVFVQDRPHPPADSPCTATLFTFGSGREYEARRDARGFVWRGRPVVLGSRRWVTTVPPGTGPLAATLEMFRERVARLEPSLLRRHWPPMSYMAIPSVLTSADDLAAEMEAYRGPDEVAVGELRARLVALREGFRRDG